MARRMSSCWISMKNKSNKRPNDLAMVNVLTRDADGHREPKVAIFMVGSPHRAEQFINEDGVVEPVTHYSLIPYYGSDA